MTKYKLDSFFCFLDIAIAGIKWLNNAKITINYLVCNIEGASGQMKNSSTFCFDAGANPFLYLFSIVETTKKHNNLHILQSQLFSKLGLRQNGLSLNSYSYAIYC